MRKILLLGLFSLYCFTAFAQAGWYEVDAPLDNNYHGAVYAVDENIVHIASDNGRMLKSEDGGESWTTFETGVQEFFFDIAFNQGNIGIAVGANGNILRTVNGGTTWTSVNSGTSNHLFSLDFITETEIWAVGANGTVLRSLNSGASWNQVGVLPSGNLYSVRFKDSQTGLIAGADGYLIKTTDGGENWEFVNTGATIDLVNIYITENHYIVNLGDVYSEYFWNFTANAQIISSNLNDWEQTYYIDVPDPTSIVYFYDDTSGFALWSEACLCNECYLHIYKTEDLGESWELRLDITTNAVNCINSGVHYADMSFVSPLIGYVLYGENFFKTTDGGTYVSIDNHLLSDSVKLYPNPFNEVLNIFLADENQNVQIIFFDVLGKEILEIQPKTKLTSMDTSLFTTGIYFVKIIDKAGNVALKKVVKN